jgi:hypothetical protein
MVSVDRCPNARTDLRFFSTFDWLLPNGECTRNVPVCPGSRVGCKLDRCRRNHCANIRKLQVIAQVRIIIGL